MLFLYYLVDGSATFVSHIFLQKKNKEKNGYNSVIIQHFPMFLSEGYMRSPGMQDLHK